jgi:hypothetical protein
MPTLAAALKASREHVGASEGMAPGASAAFAGSVVRNQ